MLIITKFERKKIKKYARMKTHHIKHETQTHTRSHEHTTKHPGRGCPVYECAFTRDRTY